jgi:hypothetical protein
MSVADADTSADVAATHEAGPVTRAAAEASTAAAVTHVAAEASMAEAADTAADTGNLRL